LEPPSSIIDDYFSQEITLIFALLVYALIVALDLSYRQHRVSQANLNENQSRGAKRVARMLSSPAEFEGTLLQFSLLLKVGTIFLITQIFNQPIAAAAISVTLFFIVNASLSYIVNGREQTIFGRLSLFAYTLCKLGAPFNIILSRFNMVLDESREQREAQSIEDITDLDNISDASQVEEKRLLKSIADLSTTSVSEIMRPRVEVAALSTSMSSSEILNKAIECGYSRLPVYEKSLDSVRGFLYVKDLVGYIKDGIEDFDWHKLIREAYFVPGSKKINDLLEEFRQKKIHLALVVDEYGGTDGIVTLEDVLEEIVGEISDESDET
jgi:CBS domain containing-hemolysin-like protein